MFFIQEEEKYINATSGKTPKRKDTRTPCHLKKNKNSTTNALKKSRHHPDLGRLGPARENTMIARIRLPNNVNPTRARVKVLRDDACKEETTQMAVHHRPSPAEE